MGTSSFTLDVWRKPCPSGQYPLSKKLQGLRDLGLRVLGLWFFHDAGGIVGQTFGRQDVVAWDFIISLHLGFPKIRGTLFGAPIMRITVFWGLYWGPPILGNYHLHSIL